MMPTFPFRRLAGAKNHRPLPQSDCWDWPLGYFRSNVAVGLLVDGAELGQRFVQLVRELYKLADGRHDAARSLRSLASGVGNNLHGLRDAFRAAHLLFRCQ